MEETSLKQKLLKLGDQWLISAISTMIVTDVLLATISAGALLNPICPRDAITGAALEAGGMVCMSSTQECNQCATYVILMMISLYASLLSILLGSFCIVVVSFLLRRASNANNIFVFFSMLTGMLQTAAIATLWYAMLAAITIKYKGLTSKGAEGRLTTGPSYTFWPLTVTLGIVTTIAFGIFFWTFVCPDKVESFFSWLNFNIFRCLVRNETKLAVPPTEGRAPLGDGDSGARSPEPRSDSAPEPTNYPDGAGCCCCLGDKMTRGKTKPKAESGAARQKDEDHVAEGEKQPLTDSNGSLSKSSRPGCSPGSQPTHELNGQSNVKALEK